jgi:hypothetical protein
MIECSPLGAAIYLFLFNNDSSWFMDNFAVTSAYEIFLINLFKIDRILRLGLAFALPSCPFSVLFPLAGGACHRIFMFVIPSHLNTRQSISLSGHISKLHARLGIMFKRG